MPQARPSIVAQFPFRLPAPATLRRWALALSAVGLTFAGVLTAFGIAPNTVTDNVQRQDVIEHVLLPGAAQADEQDARPRTAQTFWREERVQRGDTVATILARLGVTDSDVVTFLNTAPEARAVFNLAPGRTLRAESDEDGTLIRLQLLMNERVVTVERNSEQQFTALEHAAQLEAQVVTATGVIRSSFFAATDAANIPDAIARKLIEIYSTEIDFYRGLRKDDRFSVVYEVLTDRGEVVGTGRLLAAEFVTQGRARNLVWFETNPAKGGGAYFTFDGRDTRKAAFLQSPLEVSRISSGFTEERYHPILKTWQAHKGVDYAAPIGTKILATADGVVEFAGVQQGYGNVVILKHHDKYSTLYAHMQDFEKGIEKGARVKQGEVIGFVGMTGLTTGPHLHFEFLVDGVHHDPLSVDMPKALPLAPEVKLAIRETAAPYARTMALLRDTRPAAFE